MQVITLGFNEFQAYIGPGTSAADRSKSCNLILTLKYPPAYSFAVVSSTYHGSPNLVLSPCGILGVGSLALLNIGNTTSLSSSNSSAVGLMTNDDATVSTTQQVALKWFSC